MNVIKTERRATNALSDLIKIHTEGASMADFLPDDAIQLWWTSCRTSRRINQAPRKAYKPRKKLESVPSSSTASTTSGDVSSEGSSESSDECDGTIALDEWDKWFLDD